MQPAHGTACGCKRRHGLPTPARSASPLLRAAWHQGRLLLPQASHGHATAPPHCISEQPTRLSGRSGMTFAAARCAWALSLCAGVPLTAGRRTLPPSGLLHQV